VGKVTQWSQKEISQLEPILVQIEQDLSPLNTKHILVLCSATGELTFRLSAKMSPQGELVGLERSRTMLQQAKTRATHQLKQAQVVFHRITKNTLPFSDHTFDALVSEFIIYPTALPTEIGQTEMARVLKPGGLILLTDVIRTHPMSAQENQALRRVDIHYLCDATISDFHHWMTTAGLTNITFHDYTFLVQSLWEDRAKEDSNKAHQSGYNLLLHDKTHKLGQGIFYIYAKGTTCP
jgi:ubiquinone/menaquinone biosynthesis C-methylase UbiE